MAITFIPSRLSQFSDYSTVALLAGRAGGQTLIGGTASGEDLTLRGTSHATAGDVISLGTFIARQIGGVAGTDEVQISHDGTRGLVTSESGYLNIAATGIRLVTNIGGGGADLVIGSASTRDGVVTGIWEVNGSGWIRGPESGMFAWGGIIGATFPDTAIARNAAGVVEINNGTAGSVRDLMLRSLLGKPGSGSNAAGSNLVLAPGQSTGNATPASVILQSTVAGASGSTAQTLIDILTVQNGRVAIGSVTPLSPLHLKMDAVGSPYFAQVIIEPVSGESDAVVYLKTTRGSDREWFFGAGTGGAGDSGKFRVFDITAGADRLNIDHDGRVIIGDTSGTALLDINSDVLRLRTAKTPASASATGNAGDICWDSGFIYVCTATDTWKRVPIASW
jgi:hypothetical protein